MLEQRAELPDASPQLQNLLSKLQFREVHTIQNRPQPSVSRPASREPTSEGPRGPWQRSRPRCVGRDLAKAMVVALLRAGRGRHGHDHRPFPCAAQLLEDNGRASEPAWRQLTRKVWNVR